MKFILNIWYYIKPSWEGNDGKLSYRRASQLVFILLMAYMILTGAAFTQYGFYAFSSLLMSFLLLASIITAHQLIEALKVIKEIRDKDI